MGEEWVIEEIIVDHCMKWKQEGDLREAGGIWRREWGRERERKGEKGRESVCSRSRVRVRVRVCGNESTLRKYRMRCLRLLILRN